MSREEWLRWAPIEQAKLLMGCVLEVHRGQPRRFMETFLVVENKTQEDGGAVVQMRFVPNQEYYYRECFAGRGDMLGPMYVVGDKARQAYHSVFWLGAGFTNFFCLPGGWNIALFAHHDKTLKAFLSYIDIMADGIPEHLRTGIERTYWRDDHKELRFPNGGVNRIDVFSGESNTAPRGGRYQMVLYSEGAHLRESYWQRVSTAMRGVQPLWEIWDSTRNGTTYSDTGNPNQHYFKVRALESGERKGHLLRRFWYHDPANTLPPDHPLCLPGTEGEFELTEEERALALSIQVAPGKAVRDYFRWRRKEIRAYIEDKGGNEKRGKGFFLQENLEHAGHWANAEYTPFDIEIVSSYLNARITPLRDVQPDSSGLKVQLLQDPVPGHDYAAGQDCAGNKRDGDLDSVSLVDALDGNQRLHVGRLIGRTGSKVMAEIAVPRLQQYHNAYWGIEVNAGWGQNAVDLAVDAYDRSRVYRRPQRQNETYDHWRVDSAYGFVTTEASKQRIINGLIDDFNSGKFKTYFTETLYMFMNYDPKSAAHTPDEMMSLAIANEMAKDRRVWTKHEGPLQSMRYREKIKLQGWPRQPARPCVLR